MKVLLITDFFGAHFFRALSWTLIHSLWQGMLLAIVTGLFILVTRKSTSGKRYGIIAALLGLFVLINLFTFFIEYRSAVPVVPAGQVNISTAGYDPGPATWKGTSENGSASINGFTESFIQYCNRNAPLFCLAWFVVFSFRLLKLVGNLAYIHRIRRYKIFDPPGIWKQRFQELIARLQLGITVHMFESALVRVPMVLGNFKPVILLPLGMLLQLPADEVEAILLHELAHIKRKDYLVNLLQSFAEAVYFFNPAVWWLSSLLREERENCCDDAAIRHSHSKEKFIYALVSFQEYRLRLSGQPMAQHFAGSRYQLLQRVRRLLHNENKKLNAMEKSLFIFSIGAISLLGFISMKQGTPPSPGIAGPHPVSVVQKDPPVITSNLFQDTIPQKKNAEKVTDEFSSVYFYQDKKDGSGTTTMQATDKDGNRFKLIRENGQIIALFKNDSRIPDADLPQYKDLLAKLQDAVKMRQARDRQLSETDLALKQRLERELQMPMENILENLENRKETLSLLQEKQFNMQKEQNLLRKRNFELQNEYKRQENLELQEHALKDMELQNLLLKSSQDALLKNYQSEIEKSQLKELLEKAQSQALEKTLFSEKLNEEQNALLQKEWMEQQELMRSKLMTLQDQPDKIKEMLPKLSSMKTQLRQDQSIQMFIMPIIEDLLEDKIIQDKEVLSFELNSKRMLVNGSKQPAAVHEKYSKKYLHHEGDSFSFSKKKDSRSVSINVH